MEELIQFASNTGFAIVVAFYSLTRLETTIKHNTEAITKMSKAMLSAQGVNVDE